jgi:hypothetical protein
MKHALLMVLLVLSFGVKGAVVQGTVTNMSSSAVANQIVHVTDSSGGVQIFSLQDTTDALGYYSIALPASTSTGALLHVFTEKCSVKQTSLQTYTGSNITVNFTVCGSSACSGDTVSGKVTLGTSTTAAYPAIVYLIRKSYSSAAGAYTLTKLDSTNTASNGEYHFYCVTVSPGDLLVKATLTPANASYASWLPTYKENSLTWNTAHAASFTPGANNIHMVAGSNSGGPGFIGGSVLMGANKSTGPGDPLSERIILLTGINDDGIAYTFSDASGKFSFPNIAYGTYKVFGDAWGKSNPVSIVTISNGNPTVSDLVFLENSGSFSALGITVPAAFAGIQLYPNPVMDQLIISGLAKIAGEKTISLYTITSEKVYEALTQNNELIIPVKQLSSGTYLLRITSAAGAASYQVIR